MNTGISSAEAMAAGLVPVVSYVGGHTEFVPSKYHCHTLHHAAELIALAFEVTDSERRFISKSTFKFSNKNYLQSFHSILSELFDKRSLVDIDAPDFVGQPLRSTDWSEHLLMFVHEKMIWHIV
jgi:hypothetical protein